MVEKCCNVSPRCIFKWLYSFMMRRTFPMISHLSKKTWVNWWKLLMLAAGRSLNQILFFPSNDKAKILIWKSYYPISNSSSRFSRFWMCSLAVTFEFSPSNLGSSFVRFEGRAWRIEGKNRGLYLSGTFVGIGSEKRDLWLFEVSTRGGKVAWGSCFTRASTGEFGVSKDV